MTPAPAEPSILRDKAVWGWAIYDLANTIYSAIYISLAFPPLITEYLGGTEKHVGYATSLSMLLVAGTVPFLGTASDILRRRMPILIWFTILCCVATAATPWFGLWNALAMCVASNYFYQAALAVYNALLPDLGPPARQGRISAFGVGVGYAGTLLGLAVVFFMRKVIYTDATGTLDARACDFMVFPVTAVLFFLFSCLTFATVRDKAPNTDIAWTRAFHAAWHEVIGNLSRIHRNRNPAIYLLSQFFYSNAINTIIVFLPLIAGRGLGFSTEQFYLIYVILAVSAAAGSLLLSPLCDEHRALPSLKATGWIWVGVLVGIVAINLAPVASVGPGLRFWLFAADCVVAGASWGLLLSAQRPVLLRIVPAEKAGEYFGYLSLVGKFSGAVGPALFGLAVEQSGYNAALLMLTLFFFSGVALLHALTLQTAKTH